MSTVTLARRRPGASDKGVQPLDPMNQAMAHEKLKRSVGNRRLRRHPLGLQPPEDVVGAESVMALEQDLQHATARGRRPPPTGSRQMVERRSPPRNAVGVIMGDPGRARAHPCAEVLTLRGCVVGQTWL